MAETNNVVPVRFVPEGQSESYYAARVDRNVGWITREEQEMIRRSVVGIAGCGGMGGRLAEILLRLGVGELRIADNERFDASNINRQFAATRTSIGCNKAWKTARRLRAITDDTTVIAYSGGITEDSVRMFADGCDVICDEIELFAVHARLVLHREARRQGIPVFVANTVGFGSHVFLFSGTSCTMEACLGMSLHEAAVLEKKLRRGAATAEEVTRVADAVTKGLFPEWPEYCVNAAPLTNRMFTHARLVHEGKGPIIATNPPFAAGFLADRVLLQLLGRSPVARTVVEVPPAPGYLFLDAATMQAKVVT